MTESRPQPALPDTDELAQPKVIDDHEIHTNDPADEGPIRWDVIGLMLGAAFVVILNETTMAVALPALMHDFHVDAKTGQWLTTGFMLTMAVVIPVTGFIMDRLTTRQVFLVSMGLFCLGTIGAAFAPVFGALLLARVVQACGTAMMMPLLMTSILRLVPMHRRGSVMGLVSVVMSMAPALGPTVSGLVLQFLNWRWIFGIVFPIAVVMTVVGMIRMTNVGEVKKTPLDVISVVLSAFGFGGLVYALNKVGDAADRPMMLVSFAVALVALVGFVLRQLSLQKEDKPLLDLRTFSHRNFTLGLAVMMIAFLGLMGVALIWPIYLQEVRHLDTMMSGLLLLPGGLLMGLAGPLIGRLYDQWGAPKLVVPAGVVMTVTVFAMSRVGEQTPVWWLLTLHVVLSISLAFIFTPIFTTSLNDLPPHLYGHGSAILQTLQQVAGAAGAATLVALMADRAKALAATGMNPVDAQQGGVQAAFTLAAVLVIVTAILPLFLRRDAEQVD